MIQLQMKDQRLDKFFKNILTDQIKPIVFLLETKGKDRKVVTSVIW